MSKQRARERAARAAESTHRAEQARQRRAAEVARQVRRERRAATWRRIRLWRHGPAFRRDKERWATLITLVLIIVLLTYFLTRSLGAVLLVTLVAVIASPALIAILVTRRSR
ncbi:MAG: hypothetical protein ABJB98_07175 [Actinomycetota bacterium]